SGTRHRFSAAGCTRITDRPAIAPPPPGRAIQPPSPRHAAPPAGYLLARAKCPTLAPPDAWRRCPAGKNADQRTAAPAPASLRNTAPRRPPPPDVAFRAWPARVWVLSCLAPPEAAWWPKARIKAFADPSAPAAAADRGEIRR